MIFAASVHLEFVQHSISATREPVRWEAWQMSLSLTNHHTTHNTHNTHMFVSNAALIKTATMKRDIRGNSLASGVSETMAKNCLNCTICFFYYYHTAPYHTATHTHIYVVNVLSSVRRKCNAVQCSADRTTWSICSARNWKQKKVKICYRIVYQSRNILL